MNKRFDIFGLNSISEKGGNPAFDSHYGELLIKHYGKNVQCEHNF